MEKIVYYFDAGASADAVPIVDKIPIKINALVESLKAFLDKLDPDRVTALQEIIGLLNDLSEKSSKHASVDTLAKKLYITRKQKELNNLKKSLSLFFILQQIIEKSDRMGIE